MDGIRLKELEKSHRICMLFATFISFSVSLSFEDGIAVRCWRAGQKMRNEKLNQASSYESAMDEDDTLDLSRWQGPRELNLDCTCGRIT